MVQSGRNIRTLFLPNIAQKLQCQVGVADGQPGHLDAGPGALSLLLRRFEKRAHVFGHINGDERSDHGDRV